MGISGCGTPPFISPDGALAYRPFETLTRQGIPAPYAFFMAGNINTLMSLWPVDDAGTAALIPAFMERIQRGEDHVTALNNTKRAFARGDYGPELRNPRVWSVLYGIPLSRP